VAIGRAGRVSAAKFFAFARRNVIMTIL